jgi:hypothetical protein
MGWNSHKGVSLVLHARRKIENERESWLHDERCVDRGSDEGFERSSARYSTRCDLYLSDREEGRCLDSRCKLDSVREGHETWRWIDLASLLIVCGHVMRTR